VTVRIVAFARVREILGFGERELELPDGATTRDAWNLLAASAAALQPLAASTRLARNGTLLAQDERLESGDELALLPPVGGG